MNALNPLTMPLQGSHIIEASAGTGKTWTVAALYIRLVLGHGREGPGDLQTLIPPQILVMTFTEAATAELRGRIRARLAEAAVFFQGTPQGDIQGDAFLESLRSAYDPVQWPVCAQRLDQAAQWMDDAAIFTIHGWSSRMLKHHAFDSASLFEQSRVEDSERLKREAVQDYWRQWFYAVPLSQLPALQGVASNPDALYKHLQTLWFQWDRAPGVAAVAADAAHEGTDPHALLQAWEHWCQHFVHCESQAKQACTPELMATVGEAIAAKCLKGYLKAWSAKLAEWAQADSWVSMAKKDREDTHKLLQRFTRSALLEKGWSQAADIDAFDHLETLCELLQSQPDVVGNLRLHAATHIGRAYRSAKDRAGQFDFSDLLQRLFYALQAPDGRLASAIRAQFPVALVDEFQDTDPWQYGALQKIYGDSAQPGNALIMIGDPKQAIYSFRGADLNTYLAARAQAQGLHTLAGNFRSTAGLVRAVNHVFAQANQPFGAVPFEPVAACNVDIQPLHIAGRSQVAMTVWVASQDKPSLKETFLEQMSACFATQMVLLLQQGAARPGEMAVLVRSGMQARAMRAALSARGVRSVYLSDRDSVYASDEAIDLWRLLMAVAYPRSLRLVRAALASRLWAWSFEALERLLSDEDAWDAMVERFHGWQHTWQRQGVLAMLHQVLHDQAIPHRLLHAMDGGTQDGERRLTNVLHLGELLQTASRGLQGELALVRYLEQKIHDPGVGADEAQLRLESDADLVQVITIHKSKGLQYPLVFLPFVSAFTAEKKDSGKDDAERLAEDIRLLYVALTRAQRVLWMGVAPQRGDLDGATPQVKSAISRLLGRTSPDDLLARLQLWAQCHDIAIEPAPAPDTNRFQALEEAVPFAPARQAQRDLRSPWWTASFSALTRELPHVPATLLSEPLSHLNTFPAGSSYGTLLHDLLEWQFEQGWPLAQAEPSVHVRSEWDALLRRKAVRMKLDAAQSDLLVPWLQQVVRASLSLGPSCPAQLPLVLATLDRSSAWAEMAFTVPVSNLSARTLDAHITQYLLPGGAREPLQALQLEGMLTGFMDLVLAHEGRYYVLDYKSNRLPAYDAAHLQEAMLAHRYDVQYALYVLALHRLLRSRIPDYDYDTHVGGAIYLFLRGIDQAGCGVYADRPPRAFIEALDRSLAPQTTPQEGLA